MKDVEVQVVAGGVERSDQVVKANEWEGLRLGRVQRRTARKEGGLEGRAVGGAGRCGARMAPECRPEASDVQTAGVGSAERSESGGTTGAQKTLRRLFKMCCKMFQKDEINKRRWSVRTGEGVSTLSVRRFCGQLYYYY